MSSPATEMEEVFNPIAHEKQFLGELKDIRKVADSFDVVMFPIDGRVGNGYTLGGRQFIERFKVGLFVPMHFTTTYLFSEAPRFFNKILQEGTVPIVICPR